MLLIYGAELILSVPQSESAIHLRVSTFFGVFSRVGHLGVRGGVLPPCGQSLLVSVLCTVVCTQRSVSQWPLHPHGVLTQRHESRSVDVSTGAPRTPHYQAVVFVSAWPTARAQEWHLCPHGGESEVRDAEVSDVREGRGRTSPARSQASWGRRG